jgi:hypothetical protein
MCFVERSVFSVVHIASRAVLRKVKRNMRCSKQRRADESYLEMELQIIRKKIVENNWRVEVQCVLRDGSDVAGEALLYWTLLTVNL